MLLIIYEQKKNFCYEKFPNHWIVMNVLHSTFTGLDAITLLVEKGK